MITNGGSQNRGRYTGGGAMVSPGGKTTFDPFGTGLPDEDSDAPRALSFGGRGRTRTPEVERRGGGFDPFASQPSPQRDRRATVATGDLPFGNADPFASDPFASAPGNNSDRGAGSDFGDTVFSGVYN